MKFGRMRRAHFLGIGGSGMSGIADVLVDLGYEVSGSDLAASAATERLAARGARVSIGHSAEEIEGADVVVYSSAIPEDNPARRAAAERRVPLIPRAEMLGELMRLKVSIAVSGSHGKTSTTAMLATLLIEAGLDPTVIIGARLSMLGGSARLGHGELLVAEADESDGSFLRLYPSYAVVTNIDREHLAHFGSEEALADAFAAFAGRVPFYGALVACLDDPGVQALLPRVERRVVTYGLSTQADIAASEVEVEGFGARFTLRRRGEEIARVRLGTPGRHQVQNALAALAVADELGVDPTRAARALEHFPGAERRLERKGEAGGVLVVDDYGHHPREIRAVLSTLRAALAGRRLVVLFQPHRYTRLADLFDDFAHAFYDAERVVISEVYAAGEAPIEGASAEGLAAAASASGHRDATYGGSLEEATERVLGDLRAGDVVLTLGAGSVTRAATRLVEALERGGADA